VRRRSIPNSCSLSHRPAVLRVTAFASGATRLAHADIVWMWPIARARRGVP